MKRFTLLILTIFLSLFCLFSGTNYQKVYPLSSSLYQELEYLYLLEGYALPFSSYPYTDGEFRVALTNLKKDSLSPSSKALYEHIESVLDRKTGIKTDSFDLDLLFKSVFTGFSQTVNEETTRIYPISVNPIQESMPSLIFEAEAWVAKNFYGYTNLSLGSVFLGKTPYRGNFFTNIPGFDETLNFSFDNIDVNMPYRAVVSAGGLHWNFLLGRERLSWGNGLTGNLILSSHIPYHNMVKFTGYSNQIKYTFLAAFYPHPRNYYTNGKPDYPYRKQQDPILGLKTFLSHRLEFRLAQNKVSIALTESVMYQSDDNTFDLTVLSPLMLFHNYYIKGNANSSLGIEIGYTPIKNFTLYMQLLADEFAVPGEAKPGEENARPNAIGALLGFKSYFPLQEKSGLEFSGEFVYTTPYLYLRNNGQDDDKQTDYGINFIIANRYFKNNGFPDGNDIYYHREFMGYPYGGDAIVADFNLNYSHEAKWFLNYNIFYMIHGAFDITTPWAPEESGSVSTPTDSGILSGKDNKNAVSHTIANSILGSYYITKDVNLFTQIDLISIYNNQNELTNKWIHNFRFMIGISLFTLN